MTDELDLRLSGAFRSLDLPTADPRLRDTLEALRARGPARSERRSASPRLALLAAAASVLVAVAFVINQLGIVRFGPSPSPSPAPTPTPTATLSPSPTPSSIGWAGHTVATLLAARAAGELGSEQVFLAGWWTDLRPEAACGTPTPSPLIIGCGDGQYGVTDEEEPIGTWDGNLFISADVPAITPYLSPDLPTPGLGRSLIGLVDEDGDPHPPVFVSLVGRFDSPLADACPVALRQACRDRFVIDEVIWVELEAPDLATPDPSAPAPAADDPPPATLPAIVETCRLPLPDVGPGDPERLDIVRREWVSTAELDVQPSTIDLLTLVKAPRWVYIVVTEPDAPLTGPRPDAAGTDRTFRYVGQRVCIGWSATSGIWHSTVPGTAYELWSDGEKVPLAVFPPEPLPSATP